MKKLSKNIQTVLSILKDEVKGDVKSALSKLTPDYSMTWIYQGKKILFPRTIKNTKVSLEEVYHIKGRKYEIFNITENKNTVILELTESYPDPKTKKVYRTPLVLVLEMDNGKIKTGRHYCDPRLSFMYLKDKQINNALKNKKPILIIK